jgi:hypothetical protein
MSTILEALAVIKGKDATGGAFDAVAAKIQRLAKAANALNRDVSKQLATANRVEASASRMSRGSMAIGNGAKMAIGAGAAYEGSRAVQAIVAHTIKASAERAHEEVRMSVSGMSATEIKEAGDLAGSMSAKYKSLSQTEIMHTARNVRAVVGTFDEATKILDPLMKLRVVAEGAHPERAEELGADFDKLIKGMEIKGVTQDLGKFNHYIDGMSKALNVFGDTLRPTDYYEMFKYGRAATNALSDDFMLKTAPTLAQELGGSSTGKALSSFYTQMVGGKMSNKAVEAMQEYGLIDPSKVIKTSTGNVKGVKPGGVVGSEYLQPGSTDPYAWINKVFLPALAKKGVTDPAKIQEVIAAVASQTTTAQMMSIFATQQSRIEKDRSLVAGAEGMSAADKFLAHDPKVAAKAIGAQIDNVLANTTEPMMPAVAQGMNWLSSGAAWMAQHAKDYPGHTAAGGLWGSALSGALSLDGGMAALGRFGVGSGSSFLLSKMVGAMTPMLAITQLASDSVTDDDIKRLKAYEAGPRSRFDALHAIDDSEKAADIYGHGDPVYDAQLKAMNDAKRATLETELAGFGYNPDVTQGRYGGQGSAGWSINDIRQATGIGGSGEPVKAEVEGNATLSTTVTVNAGDGFWASVEQKIDNAINAFKSSGGTATGSTGSTGGSMPEATAPM